MVSLPTLPPAPKPTAQALGDVIGGGRYFGKCAACGSQFMSTHDRVVVIDGELHCVKCVRVAA